MALTKKKLMQSTWTTGKPPKPVAAATPNFRPTAPVVPAVAAPTFRPPAFGGDATMFGNIASMRQQRDAQITRLHADDVYDTQEHQTYARKLAENQMNTDSANSGQAAKAGLSYSGFLAKQIADNAKATGEAFQGSASRLAKAISDRGMQYQSLTQQYGDPGNPNDWGITGVQEMAAARQRYIDSDPGAAATAPAAAAGRPSSGNAAFPYKNSKTGEIYKDQTIGGVKYHVYSNGKKVKV